MTVLNEAAWLDGKGQKLRVGDAPLHKPGKDEILIRNKAIAVNPVEWKIQDSGMIVQQWPACLGMDVSGEVWEVGENVDRFKKGDKVIGFVEAAVLPVAFDTAFIGLCSPEGQGLGLPLPSLLGKEKTSKDTLVIWGGSSSVGSLATQLAKTAGMRVVSVASSHNFDLCKTCGASEVFDYNEPGIVEKVVGAVNGKGNFAGVFDCVSLPGQSYEHCQAIINALGGGNLAVVLPHGPEAVEGVKVSHVFGMGPLSHPFWEHYITEALESGKLKCLPPPLVVGEGLKGLQKGIDRSKKGVSAQKIVIKL